jgi:TP901 family phage tail tape measure protein
MEPGTKAGMNESERLDFIVSMTNLTWPAVAAIAANFQTLTGVGMRATQQLNASFTNTQAGLLALGGVAGIALFDMTQKAAEFNREMSLVKGLIGDISERDMAQLSGMAKKLATDFGEAPAEIARGFQMIARAGIGNSADQIKVLTSGMRLAKIEGYDVAEAVRDVITATTLFGDTYSNVERYATAIAHAANVSVTSAPQIGLALKYIGGAAKEHWAIEETLAAVATLSQKGVEGSTAGIALRSFMVYILREMPKSKKALNELGMTFDDFWVRANNGTRVRLKPLQDIIMMMTQAGKARGLGRADMMRVLAQFGEPRQMQQYIKLFPTDQELQQGTWLLANFNTEMQKTYDMQTRLSNVLNSTKEKFNQFSSALQVMEISVGEGLLPSLSMLLDFGKGVALAIGNSKLAANGLALVLTGLAGSAAILAASWAKGAIWHMMGSSIEKVDTSLGKLLGTIKTTYQVSAKSPFEQWEKDIIRTEQRGQKLSGLFAEGAKKGKYRDISDVAGRKDSEAFQLGVLRDVMAGREKVQSEGYSEVRDIADVYNRVNTFLDTATGTTVEAREARGARKWISQRNKDAKTLEDLEQQKMTLESSLSLHKGERASIAYGAKSRIKPLFGGDKDWQDKVMNYYDEGFKKISVADVTVSNKADEQVKNNVAEAVRDLNEKLLEYRNAPADIKNDPRQQMLDVLEESAEQLGISREALRDQYGVHRPYIMRGMRSIYEIKKMPKIERTMNESAALRMWGLEDKHKAISDFLEESDEEFDNQRDILDKYRRKMTKGGVTKVSKSEANEMKKNLESAILQSGAERKLAEEQLKDLMHLNKALETHEWKIGDQISYHDEKGKLRYYTYKKESDQDILRDLETAKDSLRDKEEVFMHLITFQDEVDNAVTDNAEFRVGMYKKFRNFLYKKGTLADFSKGVGLDSLASSIKSGLATQKETLSSYFKGGEEKRSSVFTEKTGFGLEGVPASTFTKKIKGETVPIFKKLKTIYEEIGGKVPEELDEIDKTMSEMYTEKEDISGAITKRTDKLNSRVNERLAKISKLSKAIDFKVGERKKEEELKRTSYKKFNRLKKEKAQLENTFVNRLESEYNTIIENEFHPMGPMGKSYGEIERNSIEARTKRRYKFLETGKLPNKLDKHDPIVKQFNYLERLKKEGELTTVEWLDGIVALEDEIEERRIDDFNALAARTMKEELIPFTEKQKIMKGEKKYTPADAKRDFGENLMPQEDWVARVSNEIIQNEKVRIEAQQKLYPEIFNPFGDPEREKKIRDLLKVRLRESYGGLKTKIPTAEEDVWGQDMRAKGAPYDFEDELGRVEDIYADLDAFKRIDEEIALAEKNATKRKHRQQQKIKALDKQIDKLKSQKRGAEQEGAGEVAIKRKIASLEEEKSKIETDIFEEEKRKQSIIEKYEDKGGLFKESFSKQFGSEKLKKLYDFINDPTEYFKGSNAFFNIFGKRLMKPEKPIQEFETTKIVENLMGDTLKKNRYDAYIDRNLKKIRQFTNKFTKNLTKGLADMYTKIYEKLPELNLPGGEGKFGLPTMKGIRGFLGAQRDYIFGADSRISKFMSWSFVEDARKEFTKFTKSMAEGHPFIQKLLTDFGGLSLGSLPLLGVALAAAAVALVGLATWWNRWNREMDIATKKMEQYKKRAGNLEQQEDQLLNRLKTEKKGTPGYDAITQELRGTRGALAVLYDRMAGTNRQIYRLRAENPSTWPMFRSTTGPQWYGGSPLDVGARWISPARWGSGENWARLLGAMEPTKNQWLTGTREQMMAEAYQVEKQRAARMEALTSSQRSQEAMLTLQRQRGQISGKDYDAQRKKMLEEYAEKRTKLGREYDRQLAPIVGPANVEATKKMYQVEEKLRESQMLLANAIVKLITAIFALIETILLPLRLFGIGPDVYSPTAEEGQQPGAENISRSIEDMTREMEKSIQKIDEVKNSINNMANGLLYAIYQTNYILDFISALMQYAVSPDKWLGGPPNPFPESREAWEQKNRLGLEHRRPWYPGGSTEERDKALKEKMMSGDYEPTTGLPYKELNVEDAGKIVAMERKKREEALGAFDTTLGMKPPAEGEQSSEEGKIRSFFAGIPLVGGLFESTPPATVPGSELPAKKAATGMGEPGTPPENIYSMGGASAAGSTKPAPGESAVTPPTSSINETMGQVTGMMSGLPGGSQAQGAMAGAGTLQGLLGSGQQEIPTGMTGIDEGLPDEALAAGIEQEMAATPGPTMPTGKPASTKQAAAAARGRSLRLPWEEPGHYRFAPTRGPMARAREKSMFDSLGDAFRSVGDSINSWLNKIYDKATMPQREKELADEIKKAKAEGIDWLGIAKVVVPIVASAFIIDQILKHSKYGPGGLGGLFSRGGELGKTFMNLWVDKDLKFALREMYRWFRRTAEGPGAGMFGEGKDLLKDILWGKKKSVTDVVVDPETGWTKVIDRITRSGGLLGRQSSIDQFFGLSEFKDDTLPKFSKNFAKWLGIDDMKKDSEALRKKVKDFINNENGYRDELLKELEVKKKLSSISRSLGLDVMWKDTKGFMGEFYNDLAESLKLPKAGVMKEFIESMKQGRLLPRAGEWVSERMFKDLDEYGATSVYNKAKMYAMNQKFREKVHSNIEDMWDDSIGKFGGPGAEDLKKDLKKTFEPINKKSGEFFERYGEKTRDVLGTKPATRSKPFYKMKYTDLQGNELYQDEDGRWRYKENIGYYEEAEQEVHWGEPGQERVTGRYEHEKGEEYYGEVQEEQGERLGYENEYLGYSEILWGEEKGGKKLIPDLMEKIQDRLLGPERTEGTLYEKMKRYLGEDTEYFDDVNKRLKAGLNTFIEGVEEFSENLEDIEWDEELGEFVDKAGQVVTVYDKNGMKITSPTKELTEAGVGYSYMKGGLFGKGGVFGKGGIWGEGGALEGLLGRGAAIFGEEGVLGGLLARIGLGGVSEGIAGLLGGGLAEMAGAAGGMLAGGVASVGAAIGAETAIGAALIGLGATLEAIPGIGWVGGTALILTGLLLPKIIELVTGQKEGNEISKAQVNATREYHKAAREGRINEYLNEQQGGGNQGGQAGGIFQGVLDAVGFGWLGGLVGQGPDISKMPGVETFAPEKGSGMFDWLEKVLPIPTSLGSFRSPLKLYKGFSGAMPQQVVFPQLDPDLFKQKAVETGRAMANESGGTNITFTEGSIVIYALEEDGLEQAVYDAIVKAVRKVE